MSKNNDNEKTKPGFPVIDDNGKVLDEQKARIMREVQLEELRKQKDAEMAKLNKRKKEIEKSLEENKPEYDNTELSSVQVQTPEFLAYSQVLGDFDKLVQIASKKGNQIESLDLDSKLSLKERIKVIEERMFEIRGDDPELLARHYQGRSRVSAYDPLNEWDPDGQPDVTEKDFDDLPTVPDKSIPTEMNKERKISESSIKSDVSDIAKVEKSNSKKGMPQIKPNRKTNWGTKAIIGATLAAGLTTGGIIAATQLDGCYSNPTIAQNTADAGREAGETIPNIGQYDSGLPGQFETGIDGGANPFANILDVEIHEENRSTILEEGIADGGLEAGLTAADGSFDMEFDTDGGLITDQDGGIPIIEDQDSTPELLEEDRSVPTIMRPIQESAGTDNNRTYIPMASKNVTWTSLREAYNTRDFTPILGEEVVEQIQNYVTTQMRAGDLSIAVDAMADTPGDRGANHWHGYMRGAAVASVALDTFQREIITLAREARAEGQLDDELRAVDRSLERRNSRGGHVEMSNALRTVAAYLMSQGETFGSTGVFVNNHGELAQYTLEDGTTDDFDRRGVELSGAGRNTPFEAVVREYLDETNLPDTTFRVESVSGSELELHETDGYREFTNDSLAYRLNRATGRRIAQQGDHREENVADNVLVTAEPVSESPEPRLEEPGLTPIPIPTVGNATITLEDLQAASNRSQETPEVDPRNMVVYDPRQCVALDYSTIPDSVFERLQTLSEERGMDIIRLREAQRYTTTIDWSEITEEGFNQLFSDARRQGISLMPFSMFNVHNIIQNGGVTETGDNLIGYEELLQNFERDVNSYMHFDSSCTPNEAFAVNRYLVEGAGNRRVASGLTTTRLMSEEERQEYDSSMQQQRVACFGQHQEGPVLQDYRELLATYMTIRDQLEGSTAQFLAQVDGHYMNLSCGPRGERVIFNRYLGLSNRLATLGRRIGIGATAESVIRPARSRGRELVRSGAVTPVDQDFSRPDYVQDTQVDEDTQEPSDTASHSERPTLYDHTMESLESVQARLERGLETIDLVNIACMSAEDLAENGYDVSEAGIVSARQRLCTAYEGTLEQATTMVFCGSGSDPTHRQNVISIETGLAQPDEISSVCEEMYSLSVANVERSQRSVNFVQSEAERLREEYNTECAANPDNEACDDYEEPSPEPQAPQPSNEHIAPSSDDPLDNRGTDILADGDDIFGGEDGVGCLVPGLCDNEPEELESTTERVETQTEDTENLGIIGSIVDTVRDVYNSVVEPAGEQIYGLVMDNFGDSPSEQRLARAYDVLDMAEENPNMTYAQIGQEMGISASTVAADLDRADPEYRSQRREQRISALQNRRREALDVFESICEQYETVTAALDHVQSEMKTRGVELSKTTLGRDVQRAYNASNSVSHSHMA